ncbi:hypothetical protein PaG_03870 [Moesziomyces aphidis]|uniref:Beta-fructofuranosidase n=1 Tax=Moesziomyces aphidis TaxID=84754 RepID=W3VJR3_MOEAP|nr:hypothetical protein PaG_03870 [Moesziomyces aphidis]
MSPVPTSTSVLPPQAVVEARTSAADAESSQSFQKRIMRPAQLPLPQQNGRLLQDSHPSASSEDSSSSSPTLFPVTTPASSGVPSPTDEVKQADMLTPHAALENVTRSTRALFEQWRPTSHFLGPHGWMNDPCGPSYDPRTRLYHLWYQWNPNASTWGSICWGHAYSYDMIHWTSRPYPVIEPGSNHDSEGVFTGCVLHRAPLGTAAEAAETGEMTAIYTAVSKLPIHHTLPYNFGSEKVVLSTSKDGGETWVPHGLVLDGPPEHLDVISWRDPYIAPWPVLDAALGRTDQQPGLYALIAGGIKDTTPTIFAYSIDNTDLSQWTFVGTLADVGRNHKAAPYGVDLGKNWEVANFFTICDTAGPASAEYLLINVEGCTEPGPARAAVYMKTLPDVQRDANGEIRLQPAHVGLLDHGCLYAASSFHDEQHDRRIMWGWITEDDLPEDYYNTQGWAGLISLPRELFHHPTSTQLGIRPAQEVERLRDGAQHICITPSDQAATTVVELAEVDSLGAISVDEVASRSYEVEMKLSAGLPGVVVAHSSDMATRTVVYVTDSQLVVDRSLSAGKEAVLAKGLKVNTSTLRAPLAPTADDTHSLRLFLDNSVLEVFVDDVIALSTRVYPDPADVGLSILRSSHAQQADLAPVNIWQGLSKALVA